MSEKAQEKDRKEKKARLLHSVAHQLEITASTLQISEQSIIERGVELAFKELEQTGRIQAPTESARAPLSKTDEAILKFFRTAETSGDARISLANIVLTHLKLPRLKYPNEK